MTTGKTKGFGLVSRNAREKAAEQATKTLNSVDTANDDNASTPTPPMEQGTSAPDPAAPITETETPAIALSPSVESTTPEPVPSIAVGIESTNDESTHSEPATPEPTLSETTVPEPAPKPASTKREGKNKKTSDTPAAPLNAARVSPRAHKLLNMISSLENKTQSEVIDELIVLHPLYKKLKDLV
ncbi:RodZ family helix-turn-helix domain-containing protein [Spirosoma flavum]|uniref:Uncharacterized protein n=1 Tax=Spirosoma flavum TaxID=2048557 RepID=A0ABW6ATE8_9BACT